jgi:hypothetical protein
VEKWPSEPEQSLLKYFTPSAVHTGRTVQSSQILSLYIYQLRLFAFALLLNALTLSPQIRSIILPATLPGFFQHPVYASLLESSLLF